MYVFSEYASFVCIQKQSLLGLQKVFESSVCVYFIDISLYTLQVSRIWHCTKNVWINSTPQQTGNSHNGSGTGSSRQQEDAQTSRKSSVSFTYIRNAFKKYFLTKRPTYSSHVRVVIISGGFFRRFRLQVSAEPSNIMISMFPVFRG